MTDFRALCAELVDIATAHCHPDDDAVGYCAAVLARARATLDQPEPETPTDKDLLELMPESMRDEFSYAARVCSDEFSYAADAIGRRVKPGIFRVALNTAALEYARIVLDKYGGK